MDGVIPAYVSSVVSSNKRRHAPDITDSNSGSSGSSGDSSSSSSGDSSRHAPDIPDSSGGGGDVVFSVSTAASPEYDAFERDIAVVTFYFESAEIFEFSRDARLTWVGFISQIGGLMGLCLGFSFISGVEILFWFTYRLAKNMGRR